MKLDWSSAEEFLKEGTAAGYLMGIIEAEKIFRDFLFQQGFKIRNWSKANQILNPLISQPAEFAQARRIYRRVILEPCFKIGPEETKKTIRRYWQAIEDLNEAINYLSPRKKLWLKIKCFFI